MASIDAEVSGAVSEITTRNSTESPLLRLPGELRNRILGYAVGGYTVIVAVHCNPSVRPGPQLKGRLAIAHQFVNNQCPKSRRDYMLGIYLNRSISTEDLSDFRGATCSLDGVDQILTVTRVCRQLYHETALLQFKTNCFHFNSMDALDLFTEKLASIQLRAITAISIGMGYMYGHRFHMTSRPQPHIRVFFSGLKKLFMTAGAMEIFSGATPHARLVTAVDRLSFGGDEGKGLWVGCFCVLDETAVLKDAVGFTIGAGVASSS
ncbi:uncharacterized protein J4E92_003844 [Alternaria infectoria]|uniref:uncharacterized protein n=1 Tax=Alternaria infectoria TaxID=45303 RepID=UPI00221E436A|nr:uncharacterized protein J4E92_003844 [Alternaria infectoria]KAI4931946.1 hypothetical protein J4E92_003844 [Alternaria infectoria]